VSKPVVQTKPAAQQVTKKTKQAPVLAAPTATKKVPLAENKKAAQQQVQHQQGVKGGEKKKPRKKKVAQDSSVAVSA
jgi:hypothetical protein